MAAYEYFAATTTNLFIEHVKAKAEAYGWTIDYYIAGRLHLHNADGAHFELYYDSDTSAIIRGCTSYASGSAATAQPDISGVCKIVPSQPHLIVVGPHSIFIKVFSATDARNMQFGSIVDKAGAWTGGACISCTLSLYIGFYSNMLWAVAATQWNSQVYINGAWTTLLATSAGSVTGAIDSSIYAKMPFAYSGGILPCPILLVRINPTTTSYRDPIGYAPDARLFGGGNVYAQLEEIVIDGETWIGINQLETGGTFSASPDLLIRLAS